MKNNKPAALRIKSAIILACLMVAHTMVAAFLVIPRNDNRLPLSVWLNAQSIGGLTINEAIVHLEASIPEQIVVRYTDDKAQVLEEVSLPTALIGVRYPVAVIRKDLKEIVESDWQEKWLAAIRSTRDELYLEYVIMHQDEELLAWAEQQKKRLDREQTNAAVWVEDGVVQTREEQVGRSLDVSLLEKILKDQLSTNSWESINVTLVTHTPEVTLETLGNYSQELVRFSTHLQDDSNRRVNIRLAGERINSTRILPGDLFSFNGTVGDVLPEDGFRPAPVIENGQVVSGIGGGVCQVSSTLYQAALRAGLTVVERWQHSVPVGYLPLGMDAAVASGTKDLVIENPYSEPVMIGSWVEGDKYITALFGATDLHIPEITLEIRQRRELLPSTIIIEDGMLDLGVEVVDRPGEKGYWLQVYRIMEDQEAQSREELISEDHYPSVDEIVRIGTRITTDNKK